MDVFLQRWDVSWLSHMLVPPEPQVFLPLFQAGGSALFAYQSYEAALVGVTLSATFWRFSVCVPI